MVSNYSRGAGWERDFAHMLESKGWTVIRSAGSHKEADLLAGKFDKKRFEEAALKQRSWDSVKRRLAVQCKLNSGRFSVDDKEALIRFASAFDATPMLVRKEDRKHEYWVLDSTNDELVNEDYFN